MSRERRVSIDLLALQLFGMTRADALESGVCLCCKEEHNGRVMLQTALCAACLDESLNGPPEDKESELLNASVNVSEVGEA